MLNKLPSRVPCWLAPALVLGLVVALALGVSQKPPSGKTVIRYCQWSGVRHQPVVWEIKKAFERQNPDVEVKLEFYSHAYWQKLYTMIAAGCAPDVWYVSCPYMIDLARKRMLADLTPLIQRDGVDMSLYYEVVSKSFTWQERQYALSMQFGAIALYYNRDLFDDAGLAYPDTRWEAILDGVSGEPVTDPASGQPRRRMVHSPWSWADLLAAARELTRDTDNDGAVDQFGFFVTSGMETCVANFIYQNGGSVMDEGRSRVVLDTPEAVGAVQFLQDLLWVEKVAPTPEAAGMEGVGAVDLFETGKVAMTYDGSWRMDYYNRSGLLNYDVAPLPCGPRGHRGMVANGLANGLNARTRGPRREAAWRWIKFYAGILGADDASEAKAQVLLGEMKRGIPIMKRVSQSDVFLDPGADPEHENVFLEQMAYARDMWPSYGWQEWMREKVGAEIQILLDRGPQPGRSVRESLVKATRESNEIIERVRSEQARSGGVTPGGGDG